MEKICVRATNEKVVVGTKLGSRANTAAEKGDEVSNKISKEIKDKVTSEMIEAGKLAIDELPKNETRALEKSIVEVYVAMATKDEQDIQKKENIAEIKHDKRLNILLYRGVIAMLVFAGALITSIVIRYYLK
jgi:hypothetical protein